MTSINEWIDENLINEWIDENLRFEDREKTSYKLMKRKGVWRPDYSKATPLGDSPVGVFCIPCDKYIVNSLNTYVMEWHAEDHIKGKIPYTYRRTRGRNSMAQRRND